MKTRKLLITSTMCCWEAKRGGEYAARTSHPFFAEIKAALKEGDTAKAYREYMRKPKSGIVGNAVVVKGKPLGSFKTKKVGGKTMFDGDQFDPAFAEAYAVAREGGLPTAALDKFFTNLHANPNPISVMAFTKFMVASKMPITDRGTFLAYKRVNNQYFDHHSRCFDNRPECVLSMKRTDVDIRQDQTCSTGFHVCSHTYLSNFSAGPDMVVEINPRDVVAVPPDYQLSKMRLCSYRVLCSLPYFKKRIASEYQDALGRLPVFITAQMKDWDVMSDIAVNDAQRERVGVMSFKEWQK